MASVKHVVRQIVTRAVPLTVRAVIRPYKRPDLTAADWQKEYQSDAWRYLGSVSELSRYSLIAGYCRHYRPGGGVLEIGCGEGLLATHVTTVGASSYLGIDISAAAIDAARAQDWARTRFEVGSAETWAAPSNERFDLLVFNESLYYLDAPAEQVARHSRALGPDGLVVVSMQEMVAGHRIWSMLRAGYETLDAVRVQHDRLAWHVRVLQPRR